MNLKPKRHRVVYRSIAIGILFLVVFSGIFYLYGYLWQKVGFVISKGLSRAAYVEKTDVSCTTQTDCIGACNYIGNISRNQACMCLRHACYYIDQTQHFSENKFCDSDSDCTVSCYEGPVNTEYYEAIGGERNDCSDGCRAVAYGRPDGLVNPAVCKNRQCQFANGESCFIEFMPEGGDA